MKLNSVALTISCLLALPIIGQEPSNSEVENKSHGSTVSRIETAENGDVFLLQETVLNATIDKVWQAYTTSEGWQGWVAPVAEVDFKIGGAIRTNYRENAQITDDDTNELTIVNYVPKRFLTLQAKVSKNWPQILKDQEARLFNLIQFERIDKNKTKVTSIGIGYTNAKEMKDLLNFFVKANESTMKKLKEYIESKS